MGRPKNQGLGAVKTTDTGEKSRRRYLARAPRSFMGDGKPTKDLTARGSTAKEAERALEAKRQQLMKEHRGGTGSLTERTSLGEALDMWIESGRADRAASSQRSYESAARGINARILLASPSPR